MATNFFIGIGGTGAKVLESLTHLCAMGLMPGDEPLYVLGIDPDEGNGNLGRAKAVFNRYRSLVGKNGLQLGNNTPLFKTKTGNGEDYYFNPVKKGAVEFKKEIYVSSCNDQDPVRKLFEVLYTKEELETNLQEGFRGHPNIGAAVLAKNLTEKAKGSSFKAWTDFIEKIKGEAGNGQNTVKIFLAGSIFGGTGAAGVPNVAKILRNIIEKSDDTAAGNAKNNDKSNVIIGGALVLPYFSVPDSYKDEVKKNNGGICVTTEDFLPNTQAALNYYSVAMQDVYNSIYLIGSEESSEIGKAEKGGGHQKNDAHIVDLYAALAALDFYGREPNTIKNAQCYYSSYSEPKVKLSDLPFFGNPVEAQARFVQFLRFAMYYDNQIRYTLDSLENPQEEENSSKSERFFSKLFGSNNSKSSHTWYTKFKNKNKDFKLANSCYEVFNEYIDFLLEWAFQLANCNLAELIDPILFIDKAKGKSRINYQEFNKSGVCKQNTPNFVDISDRFNGQNYDDKDNAGHQFGELIGAMYESCAGAVGEK